MNKTTIEAQGDVAVVRMTNGVTNAVNLELRQIVGDRAATEMVYTGVMMPTVDALEIGLVDEIVTEEDLEQKAIEKIANIAKFSCEGFAAIKANRTDPVRTAYKAGFEKKNAQFIECWFSKNVQAYLCKAAEKF
ncbi:MAG: hypothetical protein KKF12_21200 [Proteobacteria bacterium]|nr:enoyl-CoA delta isomerase 1 [Desulfobacula sp.]MBU3952806.1 hypothetical protein [Pseudomonadota bacterium]MBU4133346.1 hypothetical protein [Pseudomonadota bacterium]